VHPDDHGRIQVGLAGMADPPHRTFIELRSLTASGVRWIAWDGGIVVDVDGRMVEAQAVGRDVTERRASEDALRESEERFRSAFDDAAIGMALTTPSGRTLRVNAALCAMLGYSESELLACTIADVVHPDDRGPLEVDRGRLAEGEAPSYRAERRYRHKDGHLLWVLVTASLVRDATGAPLYFLGQIQDITEQHLAEQALRESIVELRRSEQQLRLLARRQVVIREEERSASASTSTTTSARSWSASGSWSSRSAGSSRDVGEHAAEFERRRRLSSERWSSTFGLLARAPPALAARSRTRRQLRSLARRHVDGDARVTTTSRAPSRGLDEETEVSVYRIAQEALTNAGPASAGARTIVIALAATEHEPHVDRP
jgi:PAS domain S-box-containing protein